MTEPGFTPGPWRFGHYGDGERCWIGPDHDGPIVADVPRDIEADARLIAAAPELFEALRALLAPFPGSAHEAARARREAEERARAVLAKAGSRPRDAGPPQSAAAPAQPAAPGRTASDRLMALRGAGRADANRHVGASRRSPAHVLPAEAG